MTSQQSAERIEQRTDRAVGPAMWIGLVLWVVVIALVCTLVPAIRHLFENYAVPTSVIVALVTIGGGILAYAVFSAHAEREADQAAQADPTPAANWASANGWRYRFRAETPGEALLCSAGFSADAPYVLDMIDGTFQGRTTWGFTSVKTGIQAVVMKLQHGWPGELTVTVPNAAVTRTAKQARRLVGAVQADGCAVAGDITGAGADEVVTLLSGAGFLKAVAASGLPAGATFGAWFDDDHIAVQVDWADDPDAVLEPALALLAKLADILEADEPADDAA
ncbi:MAG: hypothetical protein FWF75_10325 [Propionibacteriaceae bacterium]|nr:hypothetical protein [Propionibacteriaceae bacterium]